MAANAQAPLTWEQVKQEFRVSNPSLLAGESSVRETKAGEITAFLKPNPDMTLTLDQLQFVPPIRPLQQLLPAVSFGYLHERANKRELRLESAQNATSIAELQQADLQRTMLFALRAAFIQILQAKAVQVVAKENLDYFDKEFGITRDRYNAGDIAQVDLKRVELQRVQYESDYATAQINLRTSKITLQTMLNDHNPIDRFDVAGAFDFNANVQQLDDLRTTAQDLRPDLRAAEQAVRKAQTDHRLAVANGSTDPTFGIDVGRNPPLSIYVGGSVNIPLRIHDRNQGEKLRTEIEISHATKLAAAAKNQVLSDVDSAYYSVQNTLSLLQPYKDKYLKEAAEVRDTYEFSYQHGQAALVDFLDAQRDYRAIQVNYLNLIGSYMTAAGQLNLAVGREVIP